MKHQSHEGAERTIYDVMVDRDGESWLVYIPALEELVQAQRHEDVPRVARELIAIKTRQAWDSFDLVVHPRADSRSLVHL